MALLIAISFLLVSSFAVSTSPPNYSNTQILTWYDSSGGYHFLVFETNQFGQGVSGVHIQVNLTMSQFAFFKGGPITTQFSTSGYPVYKSSVVSTNSSGEAELTIQVPTSKMNEVNANYTAYVQINQANQYTSNYGGGSPIYSQNNFVNSSSTSAPISPGTIVSIDGNGLGTVVNPKNSQISNIQVIWAGPFGAVPNGYALYYQFYNQTCTTFAQGAGTVSQCTGPSFNNNLNESQMKLLGKMDTYDQIFDPPALPANVSQNAALALSFFYPNGTAVFPGTDSFSISSFYPQAQTYTGSQIDQTVLGFFVSVFGLFIPVIAIVGSYNSYGKDRISGVLESVLAQPVSRKGLSLSRFLSTFIAMAVAISISMAVVDGIVWYFTKSLVSSTIMLASSGAFFAELAAFIGIMMLLSRVLKSSGLLIGIGIGLFLVIDFLWGLIISILVGITQVGFGSLAYYQYLIASEFANPAQFVALVNAYLTHQATTVGFGGTIGFGFQITPSQYGITIPSIVLTGILWAVIPLVGFVYLAIKKD